VQQQAAEAERKRVAAEAPATDKPSEKIAGLNVATDRTAGPSAATEKAPAEKATNLASLTDGPPPSDITKSVQTELRRVGCLTGAADGDWNAASQRSLTLFNRHAGTKLDAKVASLDTLDAIKLKSSRVCPLVCQHGFEADGDRCSKITCGEGSFLNDDNECEKRRTRKPVARRDEPDDRYDRPVRERPRPEVRAPTPEIRTARPASSGGIVCGQGGCLPIARGCHIEFRTTAAGGPYEGGGGNVQICP
jgi:hypothetical protein